MTPVYSGEAVVTLIERKREMDDVWLLTVVVVLLALGALWFQRILDIELADVVWTVFGYGAVYHLIGVLAERAPTRGRFIAAVSVLQATGVIMLAVLWRLSGGLQNPMFLLVFALPVMTGSLVLPRWQAYATAGLALVAVVIVALVDSAALRWYVWQFGLPVQGVLGLIGRLPETTVHPFPAAASPPSYLAALVFLFGVLMFAVAGIADAIGRVATKLDTRSAALTDALTKAESLSTEALRLSPWPTALIYADTFRVAQASRSFLEQFFLEAGDSAKHSFFELLHFSYPEAVEALIVDQGGEVPLAVLTVRGERRLVRVRVSPVVHAGTRYACVSLQDITDTHYLRLALDAIDEPVVVLGGGSVLAFNSAAQAALENLAPGVEAVGPLSAANLPVAWWVLGVRSRRESDVQLAGRTYRAVCRAAEIAGEREALTIVTLKPVKGEA